MPYKANIAARYAEASRQTITTGWDVVDDLMDGGLAPGELGVVMAPAGIGKSWLLINIGANAIKAGHTVIHYTLELNENYVGQRYDSVLTGINAQSLKNHQETVEEKINANSNKFSKTDKINLKIRKFISSNKKASFALGMKNSGLAIESRSGSIISAKNDDALMGQAIELQEKLGDGFTRRFIRLKNLDSSTQSQNRRALRRAGSISPVATKGEDRISIAKKEVHERF